MAGQQNGTFTVLSSSRDLLVILSKNQKICYCLKKDEILAHTFKVHTAFAMQRYNKVAE